MSSLSTYEEEPKKILIAGLPGAGLRTIKAVVVDNTPPDELKAVMEKLDVGNTMRDLLQRKVLVVRCGGEYSIQDVISSDSDPIYKHVEALVFVLDINEQSKFSMAKYWLPKMPRRPMHSSIILIYCSPMMLPLILNLNWRYSLMM